MIDLSKLDYYLTLTHNQNEPIVWYLGTLKDFLILEKDKREEILKITVDYFNSKIEKENQTSVEYWMSKDQLSETFFNILEGFLFWYCSCLTHLKQLNDSRITLVKDDGEYSTFTISDLPSLDELNSLIEKYNLDNLLLYLQFINEEIEVYNKDSKNYTFPTDVEDNTYDFSKQEFWRKWFQVATEQLIINDKSTEEKTYQNPKLKQEILNLREFYAKDKFNDWSKCRASNNPEKVELKAGIFCRNFNAIKKLEEIRTTDDRSILPNNPPDTRTYEEKVDVKPEYRI